MAEYTEPPTISPGSAALASDFNTYVGENSKYFKDETEGLDGRLSTAESDIVALEEAGLIVETAGSNAVNLDFSADRLVNRVPTGTVAVTGSNYTAGKSVTLRISNGGTNRNITFPAGWKFVSFKPTSIAANKTGVLAVTSFGTSEANCVAAFAVQV